MADPVKYFTEAGFVHDLGDAFDVPPRQWALPLPHEGVYYLNGEPETVRHEVETIDVMTPEEGEVLAIAGYVGVELPNGLILPTTGSLEVQLTRRNVYGVVLLDTLWADLEEICQGAYPRGEPRPGGGGRLLIGSDGGSVYMFAHEHLEAGEFLEGRILTAPLAPAGAGGECIFTNLYLALRSCTVGVARVTPIVDGFRHEDGSRDVYLSSNGTEELVSRFEIGLSLPFMVNDEEFGRQALRGTWLQVEIDLFDLLGCGPVSIDGVEVEWEQVTESHPGRVYTQVPQPLYERSFLSTLYVGSDEGRVLRYGGSKDDGGGDVLPRIQSNPIAPAGPGGEAIFTNVYVTVTRSNAEAVRVRLTPILDSEELDPIEFELEGVGNRVSETHEVGLASIYHIAGIPFGAQALRGVWCRVRLELLDPVAEGAFIFDGVELEWEQVTESEEPA